MTPLRKTLAAASFLIALPFALATQAQTVSSAATQTTLVHTRLQGAIDSSIRTTLTGSHPLITRSASDLGAVDSSTTLHGISLVFSRTPQQEAALQTLLTAQQDPTSPQYHQWLTPDQFAAQFGVADADIATAESWLQQQGFTIDSVARSRNRISFTGTVGTVQSAFGASIHNFRAADGTVHFAPATDLTLPAALSSIVLSVENLSSFHPKPQVIRNNKLGAQFTSSVSGNHYFTPADIATMYDVKPLYQAGYNGANQSIAIVGQSYVYLADIAAFQSAAGITAKTPILVLVPNSGAATPYADDETESDLDLEYSSTIAPGAQTYLVYTGSNANYGVFNSIAYAIDERIAPIISISYGGCEILQGASTQASDDAMFAQGIAQGQTIIASAGDQGSSGCFGDYSTTTDATAFADNLQLSVDYPGSSIYVTSMGGTEVPTASAATTNTTYWTAATSTSGDVISSLKSYIPEQAWDDDVAAYQNDIAAGYSFSPAATGGGVSIYEARPSWQNGITVGGVALPTGNFRLVPDISMVASPYNAALLYCTSDTSSYASNQKNSCNLGFRDSVSGLLTAAGGTSFDAPIFAGMMALLNQATNSTGQGLVNPTLYSLASNPTTYASAFHDVALVGNQCLAGSAACGTGPVVTDYASVTGYDQATGLGSIDLYNLYTAWPKPASAALAASSTTVTAQLTSILQNVTDVVTITVAPGTGTTIPVGTVTLVIDGGTAYGGSTVSLTPNASGIATYTFSSNTLGAHTFVATYSGSATFAASTGTLVVNVTPPGSYTLTANPSSVSVVAGASGQVTISAVPTGGYIGTVDITNISYVSTLKDFCLGDTTGGILKVTGTAPATDTITFFTNAATCNQYQLQILHVSAGGGLVKLSRLNKIHAQQTPAPTPFRRAALPTALAFLLLTLGFGRRSRRLQSKLARTSLSLAFLALLALGSTLGLTACSSSAAPNTSAQATNYTSTGTYPFVIYSGDSVDASLSSQTTVTITVQ